MKLKELFQELLIKNQIGAALTLAVKYNVAEYEENHNSLILLLSQYNGNEKNKLENLISIQEYNRTLARIISGFQSLKKDFSSKILDKELSQTVVTKFLNENLVESKTTSSATKKIKVLFLAANPTNEARLQTDKEYKMIKTKLKSSSLRNQIELLLPEFSLTIDSLLVAMNQKPEIVHFSGHGEKQGIILTNENNEAVKLETTVLKRLFNQHKDSTVLVILNACYAADQAKEISKLGFYVIGMNDSIEDNAAIGFATGLYLGLGEGKKIEAIFDDAMILLQSQYPDSKMIPEIWKSGKKLKI